jgi:hypothetical protein
MSYPKLSISALAMLELNSMLSFALGYCVAAAGFAATPLFSAAFLAA